MTINKMFARSFAFAALLVSCFVQSVDYHSSSAPFQMNVLSSGQQGFERWGYFPSTANENSCLALTSSSLSILNKRLIAGKDVLILITFNNHDTNGGYRAAIMAYDALGYVEGQSKPIINQYFPTVLNYAGMPHHQAFTSSPASSNVLTGALTPGSSVWYKRKAGLNGIPAADTRYQESVINSAGGKTWILVKGIAPVAAASVGFPYAAPITSLNFNINFNEINVGLSTLLPVSSANLALINQAFAAGDTVTAIVSIQPNSSGLLNGSISYSSSNSSLIFQLDTFTNLDNYTGGKGLPVPGSVVMNAVSWSYVVTGSSVVKTAAWTSAAPVVSGADIPLAFTLVPQVETAVMISDAEMILELISAATQA